MYMSITSGALMEERTVHVSDSVRVAGEAGRLIRMVYEAGASGVCRPEPTGDGTPEPVLQSVLTFCYATGIYGSQEIEAAAAHDPVVRYLCANHRLQWETIREFRRRKSLALEIAVARTFALALHDSPRFANSYYSAAARALSCAVRADSYAMDF